MILHGRHDHECPHCGQPCSVGLLQVESGDGLPADMDGSPVVTHALPRCAVYDALDGAEFAARAGWSLGPAN